MKTKQIVAGIWLLLMVIISNSATGKTNGKTMKNDLAESNNYNPEIQQKIITAFNTKGKDYVPRTRHFAKDGLPRFTNRLIMEDSPYLLQHAHNPVDWYAWGNDAFAAAKLENKPVFLSIGYSTCHWCHVMEHESFENLEVAEYLNTHFISIKIDRELRPDIDHLYMTAVMILNGQGGWPMSNFLTPDGKPFYGGTYFPPQQFLALLQNIQNAWVDQRSQVGEQAEQISAMVRDIMSSQQKASEVGEKSINQAIKNLVKNHDPVKGGFGSSPKFPQEAALLLLLEHLFINKDPKVLAVVDTTLKSMARGGIYDQIGGGFHRYSVDKDWLVPHFEKMLYNQAHLTSVYLKAFRLTNSSFYSLIAKETLAYVLRDMTSAEGAFYSATDADSEGAEGIFFLWTKPELEKVLTADEAKLVIDYYGVTSHGNFEEKNILNIPVDPDDFAATHQLETQQLFDKLAVIKKKLYIERETKIHPLKDEKIITAWNGMMITAFASAANILKDSGFLQTAIKTANFIWAKNRPQKGKLYRSYLSGIPSTSATLDDYAYFSRALLELHDVTGESIWLQRAVELTDEMIAQFWDQSNGAFFMTRKQTEVTLIARPKEGNDGAIPSGNSMAFDVLLMLYNRTGNDDYQKKANAVLAVYSAKIEEYPDGFSYMLLGASKMLNGEQKNTQYAAGGSVSAKVEIDGVKENEYKFSVNLSIKPGWHINADKPLQENLKPTQIQLMNTDSMKIHNIDFPDSKTVKLGFQDDDLAVYTGDIVITGEIKPDVTKVSSEQQLMPRLQLTLQACNDSYCALPENLSFPLISNH